MNDRVHYWDDIRSKETTITTSFLRTMGLDNIGHDVHESLLKSYHVLVQVKVMLARGDSPRTIRDFIEWAEQRDRDES